MDAFYAAIEERDNPELVGKPIVIGSSGRGGIVSTANYVARRFGIQSAQPGSEALRRCPQAVFVKPRLSHYKRVSEQIFSIFHRFSHRVEGLSLDEAFLDMSGTQSLMGEPKEVARRLKDAVFEKTRLRVSVGVATQKFIAKICSDLEKPDGLTLCPPGFEQEFLRPLKVEKIWGVGPVNAKRLHAMGLHTIGDVADTPFESLRGHLASFGEHIYKLSHAQDTREVGGARVRKQISEERTFNTDLNAQECLERCTPLLDDVLKQARKRDVFARVLRIKVKSVNFKVSTRQKTFVRSTRDRSECLDAMRELFNTLDVQGPFRLAGIGISELSGEAQPHEVAKASQRDLFDIERTTQNHSSVADVPKANAQSREELENTLDQIQERFGASVIRRGN